MVKKILSAFLIGTIMITTAITPIYAEEKAAVPGYNTELIAEQTITAMGIMSRDKEGSMNYSKKVTRGEFAKLLVETSTFAGKVSAKSNVSSFNDVSKDHAMSGYIRTAITQGWMSGYLGGKFYPDKQVTLEEGISAVLKLLGYSNSDFTGNLSEARYELYVEKELDQNIKLAKKNPMTRKDCMNLLYNLLIAKTKEGKIYGETLGYTIDADGEIDYLKIINKSMEGPFIADSNWKKKIPFNLKDGTIYKNGKTIKQTDVVINDVVYYSKKQASIWVYDDKVYGTYSSVTPNQISPTEVVVAGQSYKIGSKEVTYELSNHGSYTEGMDVVLLFGNEGTVVGITKAEKIENTIIGCILEKSEHTTTDKDGYDSVNGFVRVVDTRGVVHEYDCKTDLLSQGNVVEISFKDGNPVVTKLEKTDLTGVVDSKGESINGIKIANNARIIDVVEGQFLKIPPIRLADTQIGVNRVYYYNTNTAGEITDIILNDLTGDLYQYGLLLRSSISESVIPGPNPIIQKSGSYVFNIGGKEVSYSAQYAYFNNAAGPKKFLLENNQIRVMDDLSRVDVVSVQDMQVRTGKEVYPVDHNVSVFLEKNGNYYPAKLTNIANTSKYTINGFVDKKAAEGGKIRVVIAKEHIRNGER